MNTLLDRFFNLKGGDSPPLLCISNFCIQVGMREISSLIFCGRCFYFEFFSSIKRVLFLLGLINEFLSCKGYKRLYIIYIYFLKF